MNILVNLSKNKNFTHLTFYIPQIHCSSCLFLLENIYKFDSGIISSYVNFERKEVFIQFNNEKTSLRNVVETLEKIGYEPHLSLKGFESSPQAYDKALLYKIGFAGFAFAKNEIKSMKKIILRPWKARFLVLKLQFFWA